MLEYLTAMSGLAGGGGAEMEEEEQEEGGFLGDMILRSGPIMEVRVPDPTLKPQNPKTPL